MSGDSPPPSPPPPLRKNLAAAVVLYDDQVLVVRRSRTERFLPGIWGVPCGKLDDGEDPETAVLRELYEETGLTGRIVKAAGERAFPSEWDGRSVDNRQTNFLVQPLTFHVRLPEPDQDHQWVAVGELERIGLDAHNLGTIRQALGTLTGAET